MSNATSISQVDRVTLPNRSMFVATPIYALDDATLVFGLRQPVLHPAAGDESITVSETMANRLDLISHKLYGYPSGWWAIADVSNIIDPLAGVPTDSMLRTPSAQRLPT